MALRAVFFDFSGTLFRLEQDKSWGTDLGDGQRVDRDEQAELLRRLTMPNDQVATLPAEYRHAWDNRDLDPELHRRATLAVLRQSGLDPWQAEGVYRRLVNPDSWVAYPDTAEVLRRLRAAGIRVAVVSNIAFDVRPAFQRLGVAELVNEFLLSYVEGAIKPDPVLFRRACQRLEVAPEEALMVGDSEHADGGAAGLGCQVELVEGLPTWQRPDALITAVSQAIGSV